MVVLITTFDFLCEEEKGCVNPHTSMDQSYVKLTNIKVVLSVTVLIS